MKLTVHGAEYFPTLCDENIDLVRLMVNTLDTTPEAIITAIAKGNSKIGTYETDEGVIEALLCLQVIETHHIGFRSLYVAGVVGKLAGNEEDFKGMIEQLMIAWDCKEISFCGRLGLSKVWHKMGFKTETVCMTWTPEAYKGDREAAKMQAFDIAAPDLLNIMAALPQTPKEEQQA